VCLVLFGFAREARAADPAVADLAVDVGGGNLKMFLAEKPARTEGLAGGALDARFYSGSGHGGLVRLGHIGEPNLFGGRIVELTWLDAAYAYRLGPWASGSHVVPSAYAGLTLFRRYERFDHDCSFGCTAPPPDFHDLDHNAIGGVLGATLDLHFGGFFLGLDWGTRLAFPTRTESLSRDTFWTGMLRLGGSGRFATRSGD